MQKGEIQYPWPLQGLRLDYKHLKDLDFWHGGYQ